MDQHLGIAAGLETMTPCLEFSAQDEIVVDLAVEDGPDRPVLVAHRLVAGMQVDDGEAPVAEPAEIVGGAPLASPSPQEARSARSFPDATSDNRRSRTWHHFLVATGVRAGGKPFQISRSSIHWYTGIRLPV